MILNRLVLEDVGTFAGKHVLELTPPSDEEPIILVGGLNGAGKTTILESIRLALYGRLSRAPGRAAGSYEDYLRRLIHRGVPHSRGAAVELVFTVHQEGVPTVYRICRTWHSTGASIREILVVFVDGQYDEALAGTWSEYVETFLPRGISGLFFFDGEQIEALADLSRSREVLTSALASLLGLEMVDRLEADLAVLRRRHRVAQVPEEHRQAIEAKRQFVLALRSAETDAVEVEAARRTEAERLEDESQKARGRFRAAGGDLAEHREATEEKALGTARDLRSADDEIRQELSESAPLLQLPDLLRQLAGQMRLEDEARRNALIVESFGSRDEGLIRQLRVEKVAKGAVGLVERYLAADREQRLLSADVGPQVIGTPGLPSLAGLIETSLPNSRNRLEEALLRRAELSGALDQVERVLAAIPDPEALAPLRERRDQANESLLQSRAALAVAHEVLERARTARENATVEYESAQDRAAHDGFKHDDDRRLVEHVERVGETLRRLRLAASNRHLQRISQLILDALGKLLHKEQLITDIRIDPETYTMSLTGADGHEIMATDLSAGERQLLAVAMLWGLARAAGQPLPIVIDTPLGRLDGSHREHLLHRYFPEASHQVILLSTDTEIEREAYAGIKSRVGRSYRLDFEPTTSSTRVVDGYFWGP